MRCDSSQPIYYMNISPVAKYSHPKKNYSLLHMAEQTEETNNPDNHARNLAGRITRLHGAARRLYRFDPRVVTLVATISSGRNVAKTTLLGPCRASQTMETVREYCASILHALNADNLQLKDTDRLNLTVKKPLDVRFKSDKPSKKRKTSPDEAPAADAEQAPAAEDAESESSGSSSDEDDDDDAEMVVSVLLQKGVRMLQNASGIDKEEAKNLSATIQKLVADSEENIEPGLRAEADRIVQELAKVVSPSEM